MRTKSGHWQAIELRKLRMTDSSAHNDENDQDDDDAESGQYSSEGSQAEKAELPLPLVIQQSLCSRCEHRKIIRSGKGSIFLLCQVGLTNQHWPKYPPQPVQRCAKFALEN